jgi:hypothetical protein
MDLELLKYMIPGFATITAALLAYKKRKKKLAENRLSRKLEEVKEIAELKGRVKAIEERLTVQDSRLFKELAEIKSTLKILDDRLYKHIENE